jgi:hypothetical protein
VDGGIVLLKMLYLQPLVLTILEEWYTLYAEDCAELFVTKDKLTARRVPSFSWIFHIHDGRLSLAAESSVQLIKP